MARSFEKVPNVSPHDMSDPVAYIEAREQRVRENYVAIENAKILREKVINWYVFSLKQITISPYRFSYRKEGVNHIQLCKDLANQVHNLSDLCLIIKVMCSILRQLVHHPQSTRPSRPCEISKWFKCFPEAWMKTCVL